MAPNSTPGPPHPGQSNFRGTDRRLRARAGGGATRQVWCSSWQQAWSSARSAGTDEACFTRPSPCPPWTAGELLYHVRIAVGRVPGMLTEPEPAGGPLASAADYYRPGQRFSSATNTGGITAACCCPPGPQPRCSWTKPAGTR
jgi:hypothetical protein